MRDFPTCEKIQETSDFSSEGVSSLADITVIPWRIFFDLKSVNTAFIFVDVTTNGEIDFQSHTFEAVLGIALTTLVEGQKAFKSLIFTPANMLTNNFPLKASRIFGVFRISSYICGLQHSKMTSAFFAPSTLLLVRTVTGVKEPSKATRTRSADSGRLTQAINFEGKRGGVEDTSGKRVGSGPAPAPSGSGVDDPLLDAAREERIPERIATPIVPQPITARVRGSEEDSIVNWGSGEASIVNWVSLVRVCVEGDAFAIFQNLMLLCSRYWKN